MERNSWTFNVSNKPRMFTFGQFLVAAILKAPLEKYKEIYKFSYELGNITNIT